MSDFINKRLAEHGDLHGFSCLQWIEGGETEPVEFFDKELSIRVRMIPKKSDLWVWEVDYHKYGDYEFERYEPMQNIFNRLMKARKS